MTSHRAGGRRCAHDLDHDHDHDHDHHQATIPAAGR
jgi:hypothetical protein